MTTLKFIICTYLYYFPFLFILIKPFKYKRLFLCQFFSWEDSNTNKKLRGCNTNAEKLKGFIRMKRKEKYFFSCAWKDRLCMCVVCWTLLYDFFIDSFIRRGCSENCTGGFILHWGVSLTRRKFSGQMNQVATSAHLTLGTPQSVWAQPCACILLFMQHSDSPWADEGWTQLFQRLLLSFLCWLENRLQNEINFPWQE